MGLDTIDTKPEMPEEAQETLEAASETAPDPAPATTDISFSGDLYNFLASRQISIAFTSYQTGNL